MNHFFDTVRDIQQATKTRLLCKHIVDLPSDGSAGPVPFDIDPLEKWLFEGFFRHYKADTDRKAAFWAGVVDSIDTIFLDHNPQNVESRTFRLIRCVDLVQQIANNFGVSEINKNAFEKINEKLAQDDARLPYEVNLAREKIALLRLAIFTSGYGTQESNASINCRERMVWRYVEQHLQNQIIVPSLLWADMLGTIFEAWAILGRRDIGSRTRVRSYFEDSSKLEERENFSQALRRSFLSLSRSKRPFDVVLWNSLTQAWQAKDQSQKTNTQLPKPGIIKINAAANQIPIAQAA